MLSAAREAQRQSAADGLLRFRIDPGHDGPMYGWICPELLRPVTTGYPVYVLPSMSELSPFVVRAGTARPQLRRRQTVCDACMDEDLEEGAKCFRCGTRCPKCNKRDPKTGIYIKTYCADTCGFRQVQFQGDDTLTDFGRWLFNPRHRGCTALAHNMKVSYIKLVAFSLRVYASLVNIVLIRFVIYFFFGAVTTILRNFTFSGLRRRLPPSVPRDEQYPA